jgi:arylsulfatase A-like enzyme
MGKKQSGHEYLYWEFHEQGGKTALRMGDWKAVKLNIDKVSQGAMELYDLSKDEGETTDLSASNPEIVRKMEELMKQAHTPSEVFPFANEINKL